MIVLMNTGGVAMTNCNLVADESTKQAVLFDAPNHTVRPLLDDAVKRGWEVIGLWLTHGHSDHFADHAEVRKRFPKAQILIHQQDAAKARNPDQSIAPDCKHHIDQEWICNARRALASFALKAFTSVADGVASVGSVV